MLEINNRTPHCSHTPVESSREQLLPTIKSKTLSLDCMMLWVYKIKRYIGGKNIAWQDDCFIDLCCSVTVIKIEIELFYCWCCPEPETKCNKTTAFQSFSHSYCNYAVKRQTVLDLWPSNVMSNLPKKLLNIWFWSYDSHSTSPSHVIFQQRTPIE